MFPSFELFGRTVAMYPLVSAVGILSAGALACRLTGKHGRDDNDMISLMLFAAIGAILGSHILYGITNAGLVFELIRTGVLRIESPRGLWNVLSAVFGGSVFYGGLIGGMVSAVLYAKRKRLNLAEYTDYAAPAVPLFHAFGRIGCFLGGCCYGVESDFGFVYTHSPMESANGVRRFPVQLAESFFNLVLFIVMMKLLNRRKTKGLCFLLYLLMYSAGRFVLEFWRGDEIRGFVFGISTSQFISVLLFVSSVVMLAAKRVKRKTAD